MIHVPFICAVNIFKSHVRLCFLVLCAQLTRHYMDRLIHALMEDKRSSLKLGGTRRNLIRREIFLK